MATQALTDLPKGCLIDGRWVATDAALPVIDPSDGAAFAEIAAGGPREIAAAVAAAAGMGPIGPVPIPLSLVSAPARARAVRFFK